MPSDATGGDDRSPTFLRLKGIQMRMRCKPQVAHRVEEAFVTVEQLVEAVESDKDLTEYDGIGPKTAETIEEWWDERFDREENARSSTVEWTGKSSASIHLHNSWEDALGDRSPRTGGSREADDER